jgi:Xaa-Pro aminopeptidase
MDRSRPGGNVRKDLDRLMQERGIAGMVVFANDGYDPAMYYATGERLMRAVYFRGADGRAYLIHDPMERDDAERVGCDHAPFMQHGMNKLIDEEVHEPRIYGRLIAETLETMGMRGRVAFFGNLDAGYAWQMFQRIREVAPDVEVDTSQPDIMTLARATKEPDELDAIRFASRGTVEAMNAAIEFMRSLERKGDTFHANGSGPVKLGDIRSVIRQTFLRNGVAEAAPSIVSQGRDAGVPHNRGNDEELVRGGVPILIDLFPGEAGGGYFSDMTRTFCLGKAPDALRESHTQVKEAFDVAMSTLKLGASCRAYQDAVCDVLEKHGHETPRTRAGTQEGYVHGLGHGVGLSVHEAPRLGGPENNPDVLEAGMVITVEPGLYYPSRGLGMRIEDLVIVNADGTFENATPVTYELEIETTG